MILSARYVRRPRRSYICDWCARPLEAHIYLYGAAEREKPWGLRLHIGCLASDRSNPKLAAALKQAEEATP